MALYWASHRRENIVCTTHLHQRSLLLLLLLASGSSHCRSTYEAPRGLLLPPGWTTCILGRMIDFHGTWHAASDDTSWLSRAKVGAICCSWIFLIYLSDNSQRQDSGKSTKCWVPQNIRIISSTIKTLVSSDDGAVHAELFVQLTDVARAERLDPLLFSLLLNERIFRFMLKIRRVT